MGGRAAAITVNSRSSQWAEITSTAFGRAPSWRGISRRDCSRRSYMPLDCSIMYGQGPPPCEMK
jgi:hypothetical protein